MEKEEGGRVDGDRAYPGGMGSDEWAVPPPQRKFFLNFQVKDAGLVHFYCEKTILVVRNWVA